MTLLAANAGPAAKLAQADAADGGAVDVDDPGVTLPADRTRERQFERARRLFAEARWSDAAALCDELLAAPRDVFIRDPAVPATQRSLKAEVQRLIDGQGGRAREAYQLLCASRAERMLREAIAADDRDAIHDVARRWLATPAGTAAALIAALTALESGQPAMAAAWLERLSATVAARGLEPTIEALLEKARAASSPGRTPSDGNGIASASPPLPVARYRVPLTRRPQEAHRLEQRRRFRAARGLPALPAADVAVWEGLILTRTIDGVLAVDLATGKRAWFCPASPANHEPDGVFEDATSFAITAARGVVVVIEGRKRSDATPRVGLPRLPADGSGPGNSLVAYDIGTGGRLRWRLPPADVGAEADGRNAWFLGAPLAVDGDLYSIVEDKGEVRLEVVDIASGTVSWRQPLAEVDEPMAVDQEAARGRRLAGLAPALADGTLVCPLGAGTVVAVDLATRTLRWAFHYPPAAAGDDAEAAAGGRPSASAAPHRDSRPVIAGGRVLLAPHDCDHLLCLDLRTGAAAWTLESGGGLEVAGVVDGKAIAVGRSAVVALALADGRRLWELPFDRAGGRPSGRGIVTPTSLLLPLDSPGVAEVRLDDGTVLGHGSSRGDVVPGNLVAHRDAVISRGLGTLDVFHQTAALEERLAASGREGAESAWSSHWRGQLELERGRVASGLALLRDAAASAEFRCAPSTIAEALVFGMSRDFAAAAPGWRDVWRQDGDRPSAATGARAVLRAAVDGFLLRGDLAAAWEPARELLTAVPPRGADGLVPDPNDPALTVTEDRWLAGRLAELARRATGPLRAEIDAAVAAEVERAAAGDPATRPERLVRLIDRLGGHPAVVRARQAALRCIDERLAAGDAATAGLALQRDFQRLALPDGEPPAKTADADLAWPLGRVEPSRAPAERAAEPDLGRSRRKPMACAADRPFLRGIGLAHDLQHGCVLVHDGYGRRIVEPLPIDAGHLRLDLGWPPQSTGAEASCLGRLLFVHSSGAISAYDLAADSGSRCLWTRSAAAAPDPAGNWLRPAGLFGANGVDFVDLSSSAGGAAGRGGGARTTGVLHHDGRSLALLDPLTGRIGWERNDVPRAVDLICDDEFVTVCGPDGEESPVLSLRDGRRVRTCRVPPRRERLGSHGRWLVTATPATAPVPDEPLPPPADVRLDMLDPATGELRPLGVTPADSRAAVTDGLLLVLGQRGALTGYDLEGRTQAFETRLADAPPRVDFVEALPWDGHLLVIAGGLGHGRPANPHAARPWPIEEAANPPLDATLWALDRSTGESLWRVPATVAGMSLPPAQPPLLPTLVFIRPAAEAAGRPGPLDLLVLDKRTGHAVLAERGRAAHRGLAGCVVQGDPASHSISLRDDVTGARAWSLLFTGSPLPPRPPFRADTEPAAAHGPLEGRAPPPGSRVRRPARQP